MRDELSTEPRKPAVILERFTGQQWSLLIVLAAVYFTHILDFVIVMPLGDRLRHQLHINPQQFGLVVSAYGLAAMVVGILSSAVVDRYDRRKVLLGAFGGFTVGTFYCGFAPNFTHLLLARCLAGLFGGLAASCVMATIGDIFADKQRGRAIGVVTSSFAVASTVGLPAGLWLADYFGSWNAPFVAIGTLGVVVWLIALVRLPSLTGHFSLQSSTTQARLSDVLRQPVHLWAFAFMLTTVLGTFLIAPFIAPYLQANCGRESMDLPVIYAIAGMCTLITMNLVGWATDRFGAQPVFLFCAGGAVFMTLVITNLPHVTLGIAVLATTCFMTLASGRIIPAQSLMLGASNPSQRGAFMNLTTAVSHFATAIGPLITGSIVGEEYAGGPLTHFALAGLVAAACGCLAVTLSFCMRPFGSPAPSCQPALR